MNQSQIGAFGLYNTTSFGGNFYAEAEFVDDDVIGLVLFASKNGVPDTANFTMLAISTRDGIVDTNIH